MNKYLSLSLLWGISVLLCMETKSASIPETSSSNSTSEPNQTTTQASTSQVLHNETETQHTTQHPTNNPVATSAVATDTRVSPTVETQEANVSGKKDDSNVTTPGLDVSKTAAATASSLPHVLTSTSEAPSSHNTMMKSTGEATEVPQPPTTSTEKTAPATATASSASPAAPSAAPSAASPAASSAASSATAALSSPQPTSTTEPEATSRLSSSTSTDYLTSLFNHTLSTPSASTTATNTTNHTSEAATVFNSTSLPVTATEKATTSTEHSSTSQPISDTRTHTSASKFLDRTQLSPTTESPSVSLSTDSAISTSIFSTSPAGPVIYPKRLPVATTKSTTTTAEAPTKAPKRSTTTECQPCSTLGVVKQCLIIIASLAGLATIFMVSTIVLCVKLSGKKYKVNKRQQGTEMMCISSLMPERNYSYTRQRNPISNGVLVIPTGGDSDEEGGDNLTLSSFLPENDRFV
ncbi:P-selectin glycoprotein ligand 1 [Anabas testudineus]|uniref:P-selectin glycoprotein ligand 1 n=1 Tax=Anabas testudineus TaxID=64144 RepID=UPI000E45A949|nr:P-selectin glycoprotein ligand 1 [Anabas testudineus]